MEPIIKIENLSKQYRLGNVGTGTISHDLNRWWANVRGKEDPFLKIGETNTQNKKGDSDYVWALKDINLEVMPGEVLGIIGKNGAGKSTLLKLLSRVTAPTTGSIKARGRIASLLEVGTGFHPELTGRENIFLNGAILGMTKAEILSKFDEIVDFAGVERYIDTPVKRYSSGMYVRLAFAVAAHLEPEILVVDEVLAVGDAEFQKKAIGKMQDVSQNHGRTVLFVSHNMAAIETLCKSAILLEKGSEAFSGEVKEVINCYLKPANIETSNIIDQIDFCHPDLTIKSIRVNGSESNIIQIDKTNNVLNISIKGELLTEKKMAFGLTLFDQYGIKLGFYSPGHLYGKVEKFENGLFELKEIVQFPSNINKGVFSVDLLLHQPNIEIYMQINNHIQLISEGIVGATGLEFDYNECGFLMIK